MTYPIPSYTRIWVRGNFIDLVKAARQEASYGATGPVTFIPSPDVVLCAGQIIDTGPFVVNPDPVTGYFQVQLPSTNDPDLNPTDWTYQVVEPNGRTYNIVVPYDTPTVFEPAEPLDGQQVLDLVNVVPNPDPDPGTVQLLVGLTGRGIASLAFVNDELIVTMTDSQVINTGVHEHVIEFVDIPTGTTSTTVAIGNHNHDATYSVISHNHDTAYAALVHNHDTAYSAISHNHDATYSDTAHTHAALYAALSHTHVAADLPRVLSGVRAASVDTATYNLDASSVGGNNIDITATGDPTIAAPTNPASGQIIQYAVLASGGSRTVTINAAIVRLTGVDASYVVASGKVLRLAIRYSALTSTWIAESAAVQL